MTETLEPCPFCGGEDIRFDRHPGAGSYPYHTGETVYSMCCYKCGATFPNKYKRELLVEAWNTRAPDDVAKIVAWLRKQSSTGVFFADAIERGDWKDKDDG